MHNLISFYRKADFIFLSSFSFSHRRAYGEISSNQANIETFIQYRNIILWWFQEHGAVINLYLSWLKVLNSETASLHMSALRGVQWPSTVALHGEVPSGISALCMVSRNEWNWSYLFIIWIVLSLQWFIILILILVTPIWICRVRNWLFIVFYKSMCIFKG